MVLRPRLRQSLSPLQRQRLQPQLRLPQHRLLKACRYRPWLLLLQRQSQRQ
jgi:hypothetical protein